MQNASSAWFDFEGILRPTGTWVALFRSLFHNVANSVGDRSPEHYTLGLQTSKVHAHEFSLVGT